MRNVTRKSVTINGVVYWTEGEGNYVEIDGVRGFIETFSVERSKKLIKHPNNNNRPLNTNSTSRYFRDMANGTWFPTTFSPIHIRSEDGSVADGNTRLHAMIKADNPTTFLVVYGASEKAIKAMDSGVQRSLTHRMIISQLLNTDTARIVRVGNMLQKSEGYNNLSYEEKEEYIMWHFDALMFGVNLIPYTKSVGVASVSAAFAATYNYVQEHPEDQRKLKMIANVLLTGRDNELEEKFHHMAVLLRHGLYENVFVKGAQTQQTRLESYWRTIQVLYGVLKNKCFKHWPSLETGNFSKETIQFYIPTCLELVKRLTQGNKKTVAKNNQKKIIGSKRTTKNLVLKCLKKSPQTRESLAKAILESGLSKVNNLDKIKNNVAQVINTLEKEGIEIHRPTRGIYTLV